MDKIDAIIAGEDSWQKWVLYLVFLIGVFKIVSPIIWLISTCCTRRKQDLRKKYGREGAYALVTGGSDGIGLELCMQLASQGFNIFMISRSKDKCEEKLKQIEEVYPEIETKSHACDFGKITTLADYRALV